MNDEFHGVLDTPLDLDLPNWQGHRIHAVRWSASMTSVRKGWLYVKGPLINKSGSLHKTQFESRKLRFEELSAVNFAVVINVIRTHIIETISDWQDLCVAVEKLDARGRV